ncbi:MAG: formimidoylglutamase [Sphingobacteriaceae bacterium]
MKKETDKGNGYCVTPEGTWAGRNDGDGPLYRRWHQHVELVDLHTALDLKDCVVILGFVCDQGVQRNGGRPGAKEGPLAMRKVLGNLPVHFSQHMGLRDAGDIWCFDGNLESAQMRLADAVSTILDAKGFPLLLGGGHEITFGHYLGIKKTNSKRVGIINIDAHLDIREPASGLGNSGTGFFQIAQQCKSASEPFDYLAIGIQEISNSKALFRYAERLGAAIVLASELQHKPAGHGKVLERINAFAANVDYVYLTIDMDVFAAAYAPGVSAPAFNGIIPDAAFLEIFEAILGLPNLGSIDIAELNPQFDIDNRTAKLAADLIFRVLKDLG